MPFLSSSKQSYSTEGNHCDMFHLVFTLPVVGVPSIAMSMYVCLSDSLSLSVCLSTCISQKRHVHTSQNFMFVLPGTVAHS